MKRERRRQLQRRSLRATLARLERAASRFLELPPAADGTRLRLARTVLDEATQEARERMGGRKVRNG